MTFRGRGRSTSGKATTIKNLTVRGFGSTGVLAFGADGLVVSNVHAVDNGGYGIARFASKHTVMKHNLTEGSGEAVSTSVTHPTPTR